MVHNGLKPYKMVQNYLRWSTMVNRPERPKGAKDEVKKPEDRKTSSVMNIPISVKK